VFLLPSVAFTKKNINVQLKENKQAEKKNSGCKNRLATSGFGLQARTLLRLKLVNTPVLLHITKHQDIFHPNKVNA